MSNYRASLRYATALFGVAEESKRLDEVARDAGMIESLSKTSKDFLAFLKSPVVNAEKKKVVLKEIFSGKVGELTFAFVMLLASKGRVGLLPEIIGQFFRLRDERLGLLTATVRAAVPMSKQQQDELVRRLEASTKKKIRLTSLSDPSLMGGFTVQVEDTVWDASVRHQLELLRERFAGSHI